MAGPSPREVIAEARYRRTIAAVEGWDDTAGAWVHELCYVTADTDLAALAAEGYAICTEKQDATLADAQLVRMVDGLWHMTLFVPVGEQAQHG